MTNLLPSQKNGKESLAKWISRKVLFFTAFLLALFPSFMKMYETSHWFREGDPSIYDNAKEWFSNPDLPFQPHFDNPKVLMRVYFFIIPYIFSTLLVSIALCIPQSTLPVALVNHGQQPRHVFGSVARKTLTIPSILVWAGFPLRISVAEFVGIIVFLILNIATMAVRVRRSLPRGSRKILFLVDSDEDASKEPIDPFSWQAVEVWAKTLGVVAILNLGWYLLMPIGRKSVLLEAMGISWERAVKYHRWVGFYSVAIMVIHSFMYIAIWVQNDEHAEFDPDGKMLRSNMDPWFCSKNVCNEDQTRQLRVNIYGTITLILIMAMTAFAVPWVRRNHFEWFYYVHHLFLLVIVFICLHYKGAIIYLIPGIGLYTVDKMIALFSCRKSAPVQARMLSSDVLEICFKLGYGVEYKAGDYVFLNVPEVSCLEWHPFSLTSAPNVHDDKVFFHLKDAGSWTSKVIEAAKQGNGTLQARLDGFYGANGVGEQLQGKDGCIFVGGGIGSTPMISLALGMCAESTAPVTLLWIVRSIEEFNIFSAELADKQRCYKHLTVKVWITLSALDPNSDQMELLELDDLEQAERVLASLDPTLKSHTIPRKTASPTFELDQPGLSSASNAIVMFISLSLALYAYAQVAKLSNKESFADYMQDRISLMELTMVYLFVILWIGVVIGAAPPLATYLYERLQEKSAMLATTKTRRVDLSDADPAIANYANACMRFTAHTQKDELKYKRISKIDVNHDVEGISSDKEELVQMIRGNIGCRPNLSDVFASFVETISNGIIADSPVSIAVMACGPVKMVEQVNSICNDPSTLCSSGSGKDQRVFYSFTEEDWEW